MVNNKFYLEGEVRSNYKGFNKLINLHHEIDKNSTSKIIIDFSKCTFLEANLSSVLGAIIDKFKTNGIEIKLIGFRTAIEDILLRNKFLEVFEGRVEEDKKKTTLSYKQIIPESEDLFSKYLDEELLTKKEFPKLSKQAQSIINRSIFELFENARTHGKCSYIYMCGQYFPNKMPSRIDLTIVDLGYTIKRNVKKYLDNNINGPEAIKWAIENGHTTKTGDLPGGLGLKVIIDFIKKNEGRFQIISSDGYLEIYKNKIEKDDFIYEFPGTIANLEFNLDDKKSYITKREKKDIVF